MSDPTGSETTPQPKGKSSISSRLGNIPPAAKIGLLVVLLVIMAVVFWVNLGGGGTDKKRRGGSQRAGGQQSQPLPPPPDAAQAQLAPPDEDDQQEQPQETPQAPEKEPQQDEKPERPEDVAQWKGQDFYDARKEGDPRLIEAVGQLAKRALGSPNVAENLAKLLEPPKPEEEAEPKPRPGYRPPARVQDPKLIQAIVAALEANGSGRAREILEQILAGSIPSDDDKTAVEATLKALAENPCPENEAILLRALTEAEKLRPLAEGDVMAEDLRKMALAVVESAASERLRAELAKYVIKPTTAVTRRVALGKFLEEDHPANVAAQLVIYQSEDMAKEMQGMRTSFEGYFTAYSSGALREMLGLRTEAAGTSRRPPARTPPTRRPPTGSVQQGDSKETDPDLAFRLARHLWGAQCVAMVEGRLGKIDSLEKEAQLVVLASTIPVESMRAAVLKTFRKQFSDGPKEMESAGLTKELISDPGLLPVLKVLVRKQAAPHAANKEAREQFMKAKEDWLKFAEDSVGVWCERFHATGLARAEAARLAGREPGAGGSALKLSITRTPR